MIAGAACCAALIGLVCYWEVNVPQAEAYDGIIVLGAQVLPSGEPSVQLRWRLDKAKECYEKEPLLHGGVRRAGRARARAGGRRDAAPC